MMSALQHHDAKLYTVDVHEPVMKVAAEMYAHAGVSKQVEQVKGPLSNCTQVSAAPMRESAAQTATRSHV